MPSSSQTVLSSRTVPSRVTCTRPLLRPPERRKKARKSRSSQLPFHLPGKRIVVRDLLFDLHELVVQATAFVVHAPKRLDEAALAPFLLFFQGKEDTGGVHGGVSHQMVRTI